MPNNIYVSCGNYYRKNKSCHGRYEGMYEWQPMRKILWFFVPDRKQEPFILDDYRRAGKPRSILIVRRSKSSWTRAWESETPPASGSSELCSLNHDFVPLKSC